MYILLNTETFNVEAKHPNFAVLSELGILLCSESQHVMPMTVDSFVKMGDVDFQMLYIKLTGNNKGILRDRVASAKVVMDYLNDCDETMLSAFEVSKQCDYALENDLQGKCVYVQGWNRPSTDGTITWKHLSRKVNEQREEAIATNVVKTEVKDPLQAPFEVKAERVITTVSGEPAAPRDGSNTELIWNKADELWEAAGKPTDKSVVLKLRRDIMIALESLGVKKTTSSTALGKWHLSRAPF